MDDERDEQERQPDCWRCGSGVDVEECGECGMPFCRRCWKSHDEAKCREGEHAHEHD